MVIVGDVLATKIIEKVLEVGFNYLADQWARHTGMKAELQRLEKALPRIKAVVEAADNAVQAAVFVDYPHLKAWLQKFKDALYEADDAIDELEYLRLQKQVEADDDRDEDHNKVRHLFSNTKHSIIKFGKGCFKPDPTLKNLRRAVQTLCEVTADVGDFVALVSSVQKSQYPPHQSRTRTSRETGSLPTESIVSGREREEEELLQWLTKGQPDDQDDVSLYSVVGLGGMGKTTLAQHVYNKENVKKSFDLRMWVCVSTSFDVTRITAAMLESATEERPKIDSLNALQVALKKKLMSSNKFLLVLDDVWDDQKSCSDWNTLLAPLRCEHKGSKIILTTRMDKVAKEAARAIGGSTKEPLKLNPMHGNAFFSLFDRHAFAGTSSVDYKKLQPLGKKIAKRLGGSPLAAKTIGALLNTYLDESYWISILNCKNISDQGQQREGNIMSILMLSYHHLSHNLRPCFAFCSTFPQDYVFDKEDLVLKWMALGLIQQNQGQTPEDIGRYYFDELLNRSFFEKSDSVYIMHDLLHDVARSVSHGECFSIVNDDKSVEEIPNNVRHLYLKDTDNLNLVAKVDKWRQLRSLQLEIYGLELPKVAEVLEKLLKSLKCVRMLEVSVYYFGDGTLLSDVMVMPDVFGHLRHLRSLRIRMKVDKFRASLGKLYNLQVLKLDIKDSNALQENMKNLISLRHLEVTSYMGGRRIYPVIGRVRKLASLQVLGISIKKEWDYKIDELEGLNMICELHLQGLENVESPEEASMAKLGNKEQLRVLTLEWSSDNDTERNNPKMNEQQQILDCLQPHSSLKELTIKRYSGVSPAKWMDFELVKNLQRIALSDCSRLEHLPSFGKLPFLKSLRLLKIFLVKKLDCDSQQLEELRLYNMEGLEELLQSDENSGQWCPCLRELRIENSPKLSVLPSLSLSLESMSLVKVGLTALPKLWLGSKASSSSSSSSLGRLTISECRELTSLDKGLLRQQHYLTTLETLDISNCDMLVDFPAGGLQHLRALRRLEIRDCPNLRLDPTMIDPAGNDENFLPSSLQHLSIESCAGLEMLMPTILKGDLTSLSWLSLKGMKFHPSLHSVWRKLASLDSLDIDDPMLLLTESSFRNLTSLRRLIIRNCSELELISGQMEEWLLQSRTTLNELYLYNASSLKSLPDSLQTFSSLEWLTLTGAGQLQSVPRLPSSVKRLKITGCNETLKDRCRKDEGADWPNIKHIPNIQIVE